MVYVSTAQLRLQAAKHTLSFTSLLSTGTALAIYLHLLSNDQYRPRSSTCCTASWVPTEKFQITPNQGQVAKNSKNKICPSGEQHQT